MPMNSVSRAPLQHGGSLSSRTKYSCCACYLAPPRVLPSPQPLSPAHSRGEYSVQLVVELPPLPPTSTPVVSNLSAKERFAYSPRHVSLLSWPCKGTPVSQPASIARPLEYSSVSISQRPAASTPLGSRLSRRFSRALERNTPPRRVLRSSRC